MADSSVVVTFEGGLDMVTPVQNSAPGTLVNCLNYEVGPIKGYRRIDGYERFDGMITGGVSNLFTVVAAPGNPSFTPTLGGSITKYGKKLGIITSIVEDVDNPGTYTFGYVPLSPDAVLPAGGDGYRIRNHPYSGDTYLTILQDSQDYRDAAPDAATYSEELRQAQTLLRGLVRSMPRNIAGVYFDRDAPIFMVDTLVLNLAGASSQLVVGDYVRLDYSGYVVIAVDAAIVYLSELAVGSVSTNGVLHKVAPSAAFVPAPIVTSTIITGWSYVTEPSKYAYPYILNTRVSDELVPVRPILSIVFENGKAEFPSTLWVRQTVGGEYITVYPVGYSILSGSFSNADASGILYVDFRGTSSAGWDNDWSGVELYDPATSSAIADIVSWDMPKMAGTGALREITNIKSTQTFYQWGTYNFLATRGHEMTFMTTGASRAGFIVNQSTPLLYRGHAYGNIITNPDDEASDIPRYLAFHAGQRLALGFANGSVQLSSVLSPLNFSGFEGAVEIGNGDGVTGMLEAAGDSTIVFGPRSIRRIVSAGGDFQLQTISSNSGALDYTAVVVSGVPLYVNHNGLCTLEQTSAYGDFKNSSISGSIDPFLTPRIVQDSYSAELGGTICAFPVRTKNQYRLFLGDGSVISMSVTVDGAQPMLSSYNTTSGGVRVPVAYSSSVADDGTEYILCVWDDVLAESYGDNDPPAPNMAYRLDHGWGFDGETFEHFIDTSFMFNENPQFMTIDKCVLYGMGYGESSLRLQAFGVEDDFDQPAEVTRQDISMPRNPRIYTKTLTRYLGEVDHANWGRAVRLRFANIKDAGLTSVEPPHILQSVRLFVQTDGITE